MPWMIGFIETDSPGGWTADNRLTNGETRKHPDGQSENQAEPEVDRWGLPAYDWLPNGLANVMAVSLLRKAKAAADLWESDAVPPLSGDVVSTVGAISSLAGLRRCLPGRSRRI